MSKYLMMNPCVICKEWFTYHDEGTMVDDDYYCEKCYRSYEILLDKTKKL